MPGQHMLQVSQAEIRGQDAVFNRSSDTSTDIRQLAVTARTG
ncbi:MAG: hypothetical protein RIQ52_600 [Pseudomonadota bacterium]